MAKPQRRGGYQRNCVYQPQSSAEPLSTSWRIIVVMICSYMSNLRQTQNSTIMWTSRPSEYQLHINCSFNSIFYSMSGSGVTGGGGGGAGGQSAPPETSDREIFATRIGKKEARKKGKRGENWEEKVENWKWKQKNVRKRGEDFFFSCFSLLKTTKIGFESTKMGISYGEKAFHGGKKIRKNDFAPSEKYACYAPDVRSLFDFECQPVLSLTSSTSLHMYNCHQFYTM